ncbi:MAG: DMT family transporter [Fusobacteriaceae bacterium]
MKGYLLAVCSGVFWGFLGFYGSKLNSYGFTGNEVAFLRMFFGFLCGMIYLFSSKENRKNLKISRSSIKYIMLIGVVTQGLLNLFFYSAILELGTVTATMLLCTGPIFTVILSSIFLKENFTLEKQVSLAITILGSVLLISEGNFSGMNFSIMGILLGAASGLCYGIYPIIGKQSKGSNPVFITVLGFLVAALFLIPFISMGDMVRKIANIEIFLTIISFGIIPTLLAYLIFLKAMEYIPASVASILTLIEVPTTALIGVLVLNEHFNSYKFVGLLIVLIGISITKINLKTLFIFRKAKTA